MTEERQRLTKEQDQARYEQRLEREWAAAEQAREQMERESARRAWLRQGGDEVGFEEARPHDRGCAG